MKRVTEKPCPNCGWLMTDVCRDCPAPELDDPATLEREEREYAAECENDKRRDDAALRKGLR